MIKEFCDNCRKEIKSAPLRNVIVYTDSFLDAAGSMDTYEHAFRLCVECVRDFNSVIKAVKGAYAPDDLEFIAPEKNDVELMDGIKDMNKKIAKVMGMEVKE